jgi:hypothetical protein
VLPVFNDRRGVFCARRSHGRGGREILNANRTYDVCTGGDDAHDGLTNDDANDFLTIQHTVNVVAALDISIYGVTISFHTGSYTGEVTLKKLYSPGTATSKVEPAQPRRW